MRRTSVALLFGFVLLIVAGGLLLALPLSSRGGEFTTFETSFFTAVSAVTVTGHTVENTPTYWSGFVQGVIFFLMLVGGLGFACSANMGAEYALFEPTHGSAPKYAGQYKANPMAMLLSARMMLDWLGESDRAQRLEGAVAEVIAEGRVRTYDVGGSNTSLEVAAAVAGKL